MSKNRMTGNEYYQEYKDLNKSQESLKTHVEKRLSDLIKKYPDAVVVHKDGDPMLCKHMTEIWFNQLTVEGKIRYIVNIEKWSADQQKIKQLYLEIPDEIKKTLEKLSD